MKRAFTLVEVLVVLFVIGALAAIAFPFFARARENSRRSSCQSNPKQIGLGFSQYERDYDEKFPLAYTDNDALGAYNANFDKGWMDNVQPYIKSTQLFQCPSEPDNYLPPQRATDYWYSTVISQTESLADLTKPAQTVMSGDGVAASSALMATHGAIAYGGDAPALKYDGEIWDVTEKTGGKGGRRHLDGLNFLFCDGHVKWLKPEIVGAAKVSAGVPTFRVN